MANNTETYWDADGESLHTYARSIETLGGMGPPQLRGEDITIPLRSGRTWVPKKYDANTITLAMWLRGLKDRMELGTNLMVNPGFEAASGTVEVRRNYIRDPKFVNNLWGGTAVPGGGAVEYTSAGTSGNMLIGPQISALGGQTVSLSYLVQNIGTLTFAVDPRIWDGATYYADAGVIIAPGETKLVKVENKVIAGAYAQPRLWQISPTEAGAKIRVSQPIIEIGATVGPYFDAGYSPDPDLTPSWSGEVNNSEPVLTGPRVAGITMNNTALPVRSTWWKKSGTYSLRMIPRYGTPGSGYVDIASIGALVRGKTYTAIVTVHKESNMGSSRGGISYVAQVGGSQSVYAASPAGDYELRLTFTVAATGYGYLRLYHSGMIGEPDIWFDDFTLVEGEYNGPAFTGGTPGAQWNGPADESTSTLFMELRDGTPDKAQFQSNWNDLIRLLWTPGRQVALRKRFYDGGVLRAATAMVEYAGGLQPSMIGNNAAKCTIDLSIARGVFYNDVEAVHGLINGDNYITVLGNAPTTNIQVTIQGARTNAKLRNTTLGVEFTYPRVLNSGITATIDVDNYLVTDTSQPAKDMSTAVIHSGDDQWLTLVPGVNVINLSSSFGTGAVTLRYRAAWV